MALSKEQAHARLDEMAAWERGWDGYDDTEPIASMALSTARALVDRRPNLLQSISPDDEGGLLLCWGLFPYTVQIGVDKAGLFDYTLTETVIDAGPNVPINRVYRLIAYATDPNHRLRRAKLYHDGWQVQDEPKEV